MFWPRRCSIFNTTDYVPGRCFCLLSDAHQTNAQRQVHRIKLKSPGFNNMRPSAFFCGGRFSGSPPAMLPFSVSNNPPPSEKKTKKLRHSVCVWVPQGEAKSDAMKEWWCRADEKGRVARCGTKLTQHGCSTNSPAGGIHNPLHYWSNTLLQWILEMISATSTG